MGKLCFIVQQPADSYMKHIAYSILLGSLLLVSSACAALPENAVTEPPPATFTLAPPTPTIDWFPATETATPQFVVTRAPTPERKPGVGKLLLTDNFATGAPWNPGASEDASVEVGMGRLTIAVQPGVNAFRIRQGPALAAFYAEITARPSLCRDGDEYGMIFRAPNNVAYYSFTLACNGTARLDRVRSGKLYTLQAPIASADVPQGAPGVVRMGVWASGPDLRFFLNGRYQFGISDRTLSSGAVGAFARSTGQTPVTVTFSELSVYSVTYTAPTATPTP